MAGYSRKPLQSKLGIKPGMSALALHAPDGFGVEFDDVNWKTQVDVPVDVIIAFFTERSKANVAWPQLTEAVGPFGVIWMAWPKKASNVPTDITENVWRTDILPTGWVDVKVCAIDETWSGLKFVLRKELRPKT